ncbi:hypothetical protein [uncultured Algoriphagus sp.]
MCYTFLDNAYIYPTFSSVGFQSKPEKSLSRKVTQVSNITGQET